MSLSISSNDVQNVNLFEMSGKITQQDIRKQRKTDIFSAVCRAVRVFHDFYTIIPRIFHLNVDEMEIIENGKAVLGQGIHGIFEGELNARVSFVITS